MARLTLKSLKAEMDAKFAAVGVAIAAVKPLPDGTVQHPFSPEDPNGSGAGDHSAQNPNVMPDVPEDWAVGDMVARRGVAGSGTLILQKSDKLIYVEMADGEERKVMWAPWSLFEKTPV